MKDKLSAASWKAAWEAVGRATAHAKSQEHLEFLVRKLGRFSEEFIRQRGKEALEHVEEGATRA